jgi:NAD(P)-dependent dehydrogenase (short-subunit alcohol dehydrogenase family)
MAEGKMLSGKTVIVTGAGGGLGEGIAHVCHREGANIVVCDIRGEQAKKAAAGMGDRAFGAYCDVRRLDDLESLLDQSLTRFGKIDGLVNNAGANFVKPFLETKLSEWEEVLSIDLRAVFLLTQLVCRHFRLRNAGGSVVNISSVHSHAVLPGSGPYDAAKWGLVGLSKSIAVELAGYGIRVNCISPGLLNTNIWRDIQAAAPDPESCREYWSAKIPIGRVIEPAEIGELAAFLISDRSACITGANIFADGGMTSQLISREPYASKPLTIAPGTGTRDPGRGPGPGGY